jgi:hypothetical protein
MKAVNLYVLVTAGLISLLSTPANSTAIKYTLDNLGGSLFQYNYTLVNDTLGFDVDQFSVYFDLGLYENLSVSASPSLWDSLVIQPDSTVPADGFFDTVSLGPVVVPGDSLGGFSVSFEWLGGATGPGDQNFELFDAGFNVIDSGRTMDGRASMPVPASLSLLALGMVGVWASRRRFQKSYRG